MIAGLKNRPIQKDMVDTLAVAGLRMKTTTKRLNRTGQFSVQAIHGRLLIHTTKKHHDSIP